MIYGLENLSVLGIFMLGVVKWKLGHIYTWEEVGLKDS